MPPRKCSSCTRLESDLSAARAEIAKHLESRDLAKRIQQAKPIPSVGPFRAVSVDFNAMGFKAEAMANMYQIDLHSPSLRDLQACIPDSACVGTLSPLSRFTCTSGESSAKNGERFAFAYPLSGMSDASGAENWNMADPCISFLALGGFVHFDNAMQVCGVRSLCQGDGLCFRGPLTFRWPALRDKLFREGRIQDVTLAPLVSLGVKGFCWLPPPEEDIQLVGDMEASQAGAWPHGAFLYTYEDPGMDCVFCITQANMDTASEVVPFSVICGKRRRLNETRAAGESPAPDGADFTCAVCLEKQIQVVLLPCAHLCLCKDCAEQLLRNECPMCRKKVKRRINVFV